MGDFWFEDYRHPWETGKHWNLKREFMKRYKDSYPVDRLLCLAQAYSNIELLHCSYPAEVMKEIYELSKPLKGASSYSSEVSTSVSGKKTKASTQDSGPKMKFVRFCSPSPASEEHPGIITEGKQTSKQDLKVADPPIKRARVDSAIQNDICTQHSVEDSRTKTILAEMKKVAQEIKNQKVQNRPNVERIHNAAAKAGVKLAFDLERTSTSFTCRLFIAGTLVSVAEGSSKKNAKFKAAEQAVGILLDSSDSYSELLKTIERSYSLSSTGAPEMSGASPEISCAASDNRQNNALIFPVKVKEVAGKNTQCELDVNQTKLNLVNEFGKAFMEGFVAEIESALEKHDVYGSIAFAAGVLKIQDMVDFKYDARSSSKENVVCKLCLKNIVVGVGSGVNRNTAMEAAAIDAFRHLLNSELWCDGELDLKSDMDSGDTTCDPLRDHASDQKKYVLTGSDDPEENPLRRLVTSKNCSINEGDVKNIWSFIASLETYAKFHPVSRIACAARRAKVSQHISYNVSINEQARRQGEQHLCKLYFKNILISSGEGNSKVRSKQSAANKAVEKLLHLKNFVIEEREGIAAPCLARNSSTPRFEVNQSLLESTLRWQFVLVDNSDLVDVNNRNAFSILQHSASFSRKPLTYEHSEQLMNDGSNTVVYKFDVLLGGVIVGTGIARTKVEAKRAAASDALQHLKKVVYTIKMKDVRSEDLVIRRQQMIDSELGSGALAESNLGCKMLKSMGWTGGGIGKTSGILEPIMADQANAWGRGLGFSSAGSDLATFRRKIQALLNDFKSSCSFNDLIFASDFSKEERKEVHSIAQRLHLTSTSYGSGSQRQLFIKNKFSASQVLEHLLTVQGSTPKYQLLDLSRE